MIKRCLNLYALLTHGYPSCLPQQAPAVVAARLAGRWRVMSGKRELCPWMLHWLLYLSPLLTKQDYILVFSNKLNYQQASSIRTIPWLTKAISFISGDLAYSSTIKPIKSDTRGARTPGAMLALRLISNRYGIAQIRAKVLPSYLIQGRQTNLVRSPLLLGNHANWKTL
jgi:hypothetical protein